ncbi:MAG: helix-turn-helix transcriptional regulator [Chloroflexi bacterium]|nr:helix-turn-helix transcriptional regulator [Chloroflexota bacterium]
MSYERTSRELVRPLMNKKRGGHHAVSRGLFFLASPLASQFGRLLSVARLSARQTNERAKQSSAEAELSVQPKYVPIPAFGVVVLESRHAPEWAAPSWFDEDFNKFFLLVSGKVLLKTRSQIFHLRTNSLCHILAHTPHFLEDEPGQQVVVYVVHYRPHVLLTEIGKSLASAPVIHWNLGGSAFPMARPIRSEFREMLFEQVTRREGWETLLCSNLMRLAVRALRLRLRHITIQEPVRGGSHDSAVGVAHYIAWLESSFFRQQTLDMAALSTGLSRRQFTRIFRELVGTSWHEHLEALRLKYARKLLVETDTSVLAIAFECGFETASNFHRAFKEAFGCAPSVFRESHRRAG